MKGKYLVSVLVTLVVAISLLGCSKNDKATSNDNVSKNDTKQVETKTEGEEKKLNVQTVDGLTLTVTSKIQPVKGDRTQDNVADENGQYIADGSEIVKASDYKKIVINVDIKNDTDKSIQMNAFTWGAELQDGYKLKKTITGDDKSEQIQSKSNGKYEFYYNIKNDIKAEKIKLSYLWIKNEDEFKKVISDPNVSKMTEQEVKEKYKDVFLNIKLQADIQN
jgi:hypothetical protein